MPTQTLSPEQLAKRRLSKLLKTSPVIYCLNLRSYLTMLAMKIEIGGRTDKPLARLIKSWKEPA